MIIIIYWIAVDYHHEELNHPITTQVWASCMLRKNWIKSRLDVAGFHSRVKTQTVITTILWEIKIYAEVQHLTILLKQQIELRNMSTKIGVPQINGMCKLFQAIIFMMFGTQLRWIRTPHNPPVDLIASKNYESKKVEKQKSFLEILHKNQCILIKEESVKITMKIHVLFNWFFPLFYDSYMYTILSLHYRWVHCVYISMRYTLFC